MRQNDAGEMAPPLAGRANADLWQMVTETGSVAGKWNIYRPTVTGKNGAWTRRACSFRPTSATANADVLTILGKDVRQRRPATPALMPAGDDEANTFDTPVKLMLDDAKAEVARSSASTTTRRAATRSSC